MDIPETNERLNRGLRVNLRALCYLAVLLLCILPLEIGSENLTLSTYYPAPLGVYSQLVTTQQTLLARDGGGVGIGTANPGSAKLAVVGGYVGIGTTNPFVKLHVSGTGPGDIGRVYVTDSGGRAGIFIESSGILDNGSSGVLLIGSGGNIVSFYEDPVLAASGTPLAVGVGTTNPNYKVGGAGGYVDAKDVYLRDIGKWVSDLHGGLHGCHTKDGFNTISKCNPGNTYWVTATCKTGEKPTGGGGDCAAGFFKYSGPSGSLSWKVGCVGLSGTQTIKATVSCCKKEEN